MGKFKVGDKVRLVAGCYADVPRGSTLTVVNDDELGAYWITKDAVEVSVLNEYHYEFELVEEAPQKPKDIDWSKAPEGATHYNQFAGCWIKHLGNGQYQFWNGTEWVVGFGCMNSSYKPRPGPTEWTGEGLPPVGTRCEYFEGGEWMSCEVVAHRNNAAIVLSDCYEAGFVPRSELRPFRTPEQIAAEEREKVVREIFKVLTGHSGMEGWTDTCYETHARNLYDAGLRFIKEGE